MKEINQYIINQLKVSQAYNTGAAYKALMYTIDHAVLTEVMSMTKGNESEAARILGINRGTLRTKLKRHKL